MKRSRFSRRGGLSREADQLVWLATGLANSGSRVEDGFWEARMIETIDRLLDEGGDDALNAALDHVFRVNARAYDRLADLIEARAEGGILSAGGETYDVLLVALPVVAWSRYSIPARTLPPQMLDAVQAQLSAHVLGADARVSLADHLFSPDQLPAGYSETRALAEKLTHAALESRAGAIDPRQLPESTQFLSDMRYLIGAVAVSHGKPMFRWQEPDGSREQALRDWREQGTPSVQSLLPGCAFELVPPDAYYAACREADRQLRPYSLRASVAFLHASLNVAPSGLRAVVAPFAERRLEEYRVGFTLSDKNDVLHGVVWPLLDAEDESSDTAGSIESVLRAAGVNDIVAIDHSFPMEYCDDCGGPLYPDPDGHAVHAELPESDDQRPVHLH